MGCPENFYGYVVVISVFFVYIPVAGFVQSFGVFTDEFNQEFCPVKECMDILGLVNALSLSNYRILCCFSVFLESKITNAGTFLIGTLLCLLSLITTCYIKDVMMLLVTHSLMFGFGSTFMLNSPLSMIEAYFPTTHRHHLLTTGIINLGPPIGVAMINPIAGYMSKKGNGTWRHTMQAMAGIVALVATVYIIIILIPMVRRKFITEEYEDLDATPPEEPDSEGMFSSIARIWCLDVGSILWLTGIFGVGFAIFIPRTVFVQYMVDMGTSKMDASVMMMYSGISEAICTLIISLTGGLMGIHILWVYVSCSVILAAADALLPALTSQVSFNVYIAIQGATDGFVLTVLYGVVGLLTETGQQKRVLWSATNFVVGFGQIMGLPIAGAIYEQNKHALFYMATAFFLASTVSFLGVIASLHREGNKCSFGWLGSDAAHANKPLDTGNEPEHRDMGDSDNMDLGATTNSEPKSTANADSEDSPGPPTG